MDLHKLSSEVVSKLRSSLKINTACQCVTELVLNSLDAKSMAIAIRVNLVSMLIQVVDNGEGISKENMALVGIRYMTNKLKDNQILEKHSKYYGFRGESLASIVECSKSVSINSKYVDSIETYVKHFENNLMEVTKTKQRPSAGTTVTVKGFFHKFPVRNNRIIAELQLEEIKKIIESFIILHPKVSFSIRNDINSEIILHSKKNDDSVSAFKHLHPEISGRFKLTKVTKHKIKVEALLFEESSEKRAQYIYINKRPLHCNRIQKFINETLQKLPIKKNIYSLDERNRFPVYVINIRCPYSQVDISFDQCRLSVEFQHWDLVFQCIKKTLHLFFGNERKVTKDKIELICDEYANEENCAVSHIRGACKKIGYKRQNAEKKTTDSEKYSTLGKDSQNFIFPFKKNIQKLDTFEETQNKKYCKSSNELIAVPVMQNNVYLCLPRKGNNEISTLSRFTDDEIKGKNLIMDMFLKSTKIFNEHENTMDSKSEETVLELQTNVLMENNYFNNVEGLSTTKSVSVRIHSTKKIRKYKNKDYYSFCKNEISSKCIQTSIKHEINENYFLNDKVEDFTLIFSNPFEIDAEPLIVPKLKDVDIIREQPLLPKYCTCQCHRHRFKLNFHSKNKYLNNDNQFQHDQCFGTNDFQKTDRFSCNFISNNDKSDQISTVKFINSKPTLKNLRGKINYFVRNPIGPNNSQDVPIFLPCTSQLSPYFSRRKLYNCNINPNSPLLFKKSNMRWLHSSTNISPLNRNTHHYPFDNECDFGKKILPQRCNEPPKSEKESCYLKTNSSLCLEKIPTECSQDFNLSSVNTHQTRRYAEHHTAFEEFCLKNNEAKVTDPIFSTCSNSCNKRMVAQEILPSRNSNSRSTSVDMENKQFLSKNNFSGLTTRTIVLGTTDDNQTNLQKFEEKNENIAENQIKQSSVDINWEKKMDNNGIRFFVNKKSGYATFDGPKKKGNEKAFAFNLRNDILPKGMSPILRETDKIDISLSPNKKNQLLEYIMETYKKELFFVKWQHYLENVDPKTFFDNIHKEKAKDFYDCIPNINRFGVKSKLASNKIITFSRNFFANMIVIGQIDKKFIAVLEVEKKLLILFDQHAVDERIRLEQLIKRYKGKKHVYKHAFVLPLSKNDAALLERNISYLDSIDFDMDFFHNGVGIKAIPSYLFAKFSNESSDGWVTVLQLATKQLLDIIKSSRNIMNILPTFLQNIINIEACTGAIKFGDLLSRKKCEGLLQQLSLCQLPFQCAHGRPALVPLLSLETTQEKTK